MIDPRTLLWLARRGRSARGSGSLWCVLIVATQLVTAASAIGSQPPNVVPKPLTLAAQVVVQPPLGTPPGLVDSQETWPEGSRLQLSFEGGQEAWTAVLWISGDSVTALYPNPVLGQTGFTAPATYVVPAEGQWLRLTETPRQGDLIAVITAWDPVPDVLDTLDDPSPSRVRALRRWLESRDHQWLMGPWATDRYLPTADGRALPAPWTPVRGRGPLVRTWEVHAE